MVLTVGYRMKSSEGVRFRQWANAILRRYLIAGAALKEQRLKQIGKIIRVLSRATGPELARVADVLVGYVPGLRRDFAAGRFAKTPGAAPNWELTLDEARARLQRLRDEFSDDDLAVTTLLIAVSDPSEKDLMVRLVVRMLRGDGR